MKAKFVKENLNEFDSFEEEIELVDTPFDDVDIKVIKNDNQKLLKDVEIFDLYTDEKMGNNKSLALTLEFSSDNRTLETKEVDKQIDKILESLKVKLNAELRS